MELMPDTQVTDVVVTHVKMLRERIENSGRTLLFLTPRGSRLYGLSHVESDYDYFAVVTPLPKNKIRYAKQTITNELDCVVMDFGTFVQYASSGVPENCEAMFSDMALIDDIADFRAGYRLGTGALERYLRTITSFCMTQDPKRKRHGLRLALNAFDFQRTGRFQPTLTPNEVDFVTEIAKRDCDAVYAYAMNIALDTLPPGMVR